MVDESFVGRFAKEFNSFYLSIALPLLLVFSIESYQSLKLWHATKQTRKPEDIASSSEDLARANAKRAKAIKKAANRDRAGPAIVAFIILFVTGVQQFLEIKSMMNAKDGEETVSNYYLNLDINDLSWADILYGTALFCPSIAVVNRALNIVLGMKERVVFRDCDGKPFTVLRKSEHARLRLPIFVMIISVIVSVAAFWFRNAFAISVLYAAMTHMIISRVPTVKVMAIKSLAWLSILMIICVGVLVGTWVAVTSLAPQQVQPYELYKIFTTSEVNWAGLFLSMFLSLWPFNVISLCYRLDYYVSGSDDALVGLPNVKDVIEGADDVCGTAVTWRVSESNASSSENKPPRMSKWYFNAALSGWVGGYVALAAAVAGEFLTCSWELSGITALYFSAPLMGIFVFTTALLRGELRKIWTYKEDWSAAPSLEDGFEGPADAAPKEENEKEEAEDVVLMDVTSNVEKKEEENALVDVE